MLYWFSYLYSFLFHLPFISGVEDLEAREQAALKQIEKNMENMNLNVSSDIQSIFDRFSSIYPTKWKQNSIVILDEYIIDPPYETVTLAPGKEGRALQRISSMVSYLCVRFGKCASLLTFFLSLPFYYIVANHKA